MKTLFKYLIFLTILFSMNSCYSTRIPGNYTSEGVKNYIESEKRITKEKREYQKWHNKNNKKINKSQRKRSIPYK